MIDHGHGVQLSPDIAEWVRDWRNKTEVRRWCRQTGLIDQAQQTKWLEKISQDPTIQMFMIQNETSNCFGVCGLTSINMTHRTAEFSLYIAPKHQHKGFGKRALLTLINYGFKELNLNNIWGEVLDTNPALDMFKEVGFKHEATLREMYYKDGKYWDAHRISILQRECLL